MKKKTAQLVLIRGVPGQTEKSTEGKGCTGQARAYASNRTQASTHQVLNVSERQHNRKTDQQPVPVLVPSLKHQQQSQTETGEGQPHLTGTHWYQCTKVLPFNKTINRNQE
jgi:hypothetical protein